MMFAALTVLVVRKAPKQADMSLSHHDSKAMSKHIHLRQGTMVGFTAIQKMCRIKKNIKWEHSVKVYSYGLTHTRTVVITLWYTARTSYKAAQRNHHLRDMIIHQHKPMASCKDHRRLQLAMWVWMPMTLNRPVDFSCWCSPDTDCV
ncbi:hypothetical protein AALO_G00252760 [Alosa alosa]|uniref:Secreted protein n=1 Tax=Alosa alosa TaxID=278164 RepID=A0AAV6FRE5_9TELE|nr:hypothetical protein AALO_G00252760 [Alosa alosa]